MEEKIKLIRSILDKLHLSQIPPSMVKRRFTIFNAFSVYQKEFEKPEFKTFFWQIIGKERGKVASTLSEGKITPYLILSLINDNLDLVDKALQLETLAIATDFNEKEIPEEFKPVIKRNDYSIHEPNQSSFLDSVLNKMIVREEIPYPKFERSILLHLEGKESLSETELIEDAVRAVGWIVYGEDATMAYRLIFEEYFKNEEEYNRLGIGYKYPVITGRGVISMQIGRLEFIKILFCKLQYV